MAAIGRLQNIAVPIVLLVLVERAGYSSTVAGLSAGAFLATMGATAGFKGRLCDRRGFRAPITALTLAFIFCSVAFVVASRSAITSEAIVCLSGLLGLGTSNAGALVQSLWLKILDPSKSDRAISWEVLMNIAAAQVGGALFATALISFLPLNTAFLFACLLPAMAMLAWAHLALDQPLVSAEKQNPEGSRALLSAFALVLISAALLTALGFSLLRTVFVLDSEAAGALSVAIFSVGALLAAVASHGRFAVRSPALIALSSSAALVVVIFEVVWDSLAMTLALSLPAGALFFVGNMSIRLVLSDHLERDRISEGFGWLVSAGTLGSSLGAIIGGGLFDNKGNLIATALALLVWAVLIGVILERTRPQINLQ